MFCSNYTWSLQKMRQYKRNRAYFKTPKIELQLDVYSPGYVVLYVDLHVTKNSEILPYMLVYNLVLFT